MIENKIHLDCTNQTAFGDVGWCNENTFRNGSFANSTVTRPGLSRYGVRISSVDGTNMNNNHNIYDKLSMELRQSDASPGSGIPYLIEAGSQNEIRSNRNEGNNAIFAVVTSGSSDNEFEFQQTDATILELGTNEASSRKFFANDIVSRDLRLIFDSDNIADTAVAYNSTQVHIPNCQIHWSTNNTGFISQDFIFPFVHDAFVADIFTNELLPTVLHNRVQNDIVYLTGTNLPVGLGEGTGYYVVGVTGNHRFQVSTIRNGPATDITVSGVGLQTYHSRKGYVEIPGFRGVGTEIDTSRAKTFVVTRDTVGPNSGGRVAVQPYDINGEALSDDPTDQYVKGNAGYFWVNASYGEGYYWQASDLTHRDITFTVKDEVDSVQMWINGGSKSAALRRFKIYTTDVTTTPDVYTNVYKQSWLGQRFAAQAPISGVYEAGLTLWNATPGGGQTMGWVCTTGGAPGAWGVMPNLV